MPTHFQSETLASTATIRVQLALKRGLVALRTREVGDEGSWSRGVEEVRKARPATPLLPRWHGHIAAAGQQCARP
ncbi:protein of unknown function [Methylocaldum szegediense]|uniref:Uncharacterized protein n=1 Tax=Methylocaldum szegediense TaxID=73780 RepID=A0ABM9I227_9GAMM|nr:protein of unknown function [Methylocaldum szegediense]